VRRVAMLLRGMSAIPASVTYSSLSSFASRTVLSWPEHRRPVSAFEDGELQPLMADSSHWPQSALGQLGTNGRFRDVESQPRLAHDDPLQKFESQESAPES
jgi:hypothetical protein